MKAIFSIKYKLIPLILIFFISCSEYLDVVPDNMATIDHAFQYRYQAESYLYGCYSFLPNHSNPEFAPALTGGDEIWLYDNIIQNTQNYNPRMWNIAKGNQENISPIFDCWASKQDDYDLDGGRPLFTGIRDCNIFLEEIDNVKDIQDWEKEKWIGEVKALKAYYHFYLMRMYGPIPIIDENLPMYSKGDDVQTYRAPVDSVVNFIVTLLDEASEMLPLQVDNLTEELGRFTKPIALALKGQVLAYAASPLFNGNTDYAEMVDNRGVQLFSQTYDQAKWQRAAEALREAIEVSHQAGHELYDYRSSGFASTLSEQTINAMQVRGAVTERWNNEIIWGESRVSPQRIQQVSFPKFTSYHSTGHFINSYSPPLRIVEQFYTENGVPIEEDKDWADVELFGVNKGDEKHKFYIEPGFETANLHFNREARFYGSIFFDGSLLYGNGRNDESQMWTTLFKFNAAFGWASSSHPETGYMVKKIIHRMTSTTTTSTTISYYRYAFPIIRLADLYLMYAEALNEWKEVPDGEVYEFIDLVRNRSGLKGVEESWSNYSINPDKPKTKEGMREIIHRERMNELAFEGIRFWDLRRWKLAEEYMNKPIRGLNIFGEKAGDFYNVRVIDQPVFGKKDYFWPIRNSVILKNRNLVQNPGW